MLQVAHKGLNTSEEPKGTKTNDKRYKLKIKCEDRFTDHIAKGNIPDLIVNLRILKCPISTFLELTNIFEKIISYQMKYKCCKLL